MAKASRSLMNSSGAGISTGAGISDFRSTGGLFNTIKQQFPGVVLNGKDLFNVSALRSATARVPFSKMVGELAHRSQSALPTPFHRLLQLLDSTGQLRRVYTQNVDCLESKSGVSFGMPDHVTAARTRGGNDIVHNIPRCIPLHGRIDMCHCTLCHQSYPIAGYISAFAEGRFPSCHHCLDVEMLRPFTNKRSRGIGELRPSVVLYGEVHPSAEVVGQVTLHDLNFTYKRSQLYDDVIILVAGTSLQIPGVKAMVHEFSKATRT
jgi:NAD-dependent SIR2 family protein deacetylase